MKYELIYCTASNTNIEAYLNPNNYKVNTQGTGINSFYYKNKSIVSAK